MRNNCLGGFFGKLWLWLRRSVWAFAAFFVPLAVRSVPEVLAWPYPLGFDTLDYIRIISSNRIFSSGPFYLLKNHLFYSVATVINWWIANPIVVVDVFGPLLLALVAFVAYLYASRALRWGGFKSFLVALFVGTYFVSLRNSWDLYAQSLALVFLFAALIILGSSSSRRRYAYVFVFAILTVLSHELIAVILFFVLALEAIRFLSKKRRDDFICLTITIFLAGVLFLFTHPSPLADIATPLVSNASTSSASFALYVGGFLVYCYFFIVPLVVVGLAFLKDWVLRYWVVLCVGIPLVAIISPSLPFYDFDRWVLLLVYPLMFFAIQGLEKLWNFRFRYGGKIARLVPKIVVIIYLVFLLVMSGFYLIADPNNQISYFSNDNGYLGFIQSGMYQNCVPISDNPSLVKCFEWINDTKDSAVVLQNQFLYYAAICLKNITVISITSPSGSSNENYTVIMGQQMIATARTALAEGNATVYTVWWVKGEGWYASFALPSSFTEIYMSGDMAVYLFNQTT